MTLQVLFLKFGMRICWVCVILASNSLFAANQDDYSCGFHPQARELANLIINDQSQQRTHIVCHPLLAQAAEDKARIMADYGMVRHNLGGSPNSRLLDIGFPIPRVYSGVMGNQVEAVAGGYSTAKSVWNAFKDSTAHRTHLLGEIEFYRDQQYLGVGFFVDPTAPHVEYWTVYLTHAENEQLVPEYDYVPHKGFFVTKPSPIALNVNP